MPASIHRRAFLTRAAGGLGLVALNQLLGSQIRGAAGLHHAARAKRVIFLYQAGGPSQFETFDRKQKLAQMHGQPMPESVTKGQQVAQLQGQKLLCFGPQHEFQRFGSSGAEICNLFPHMGGIADELCIIRSMQTEQINHDPAHTVMNTGSIIAGRPSMGSWVVYGLGTEAENLPGFIVLLSTGRGGEEQPIAARQWSAGILPSRYQGVKFNSIGDPVLHIRTPEGMPRKIQKASIDAINAINTQQHALTHDPEILTRVAQYEMAFRMQSSVPGLMDFSDEPRHVLDMYGATPGDGSFASNCLLARRMAERGVRFIQLYHRDWDHHGNVKRGVQTKAQEVDRPTAALIRDLKQRGMLEDTLVIWGGEFGRTPMSQGGNGRDHHIKAFTCLMAGGGVRGGLTYGETDELGYNVIENPVTVHDFHATMLHLLGVDHLRLAVKSQGLDVRLTGVSGSVVRGILA